MVDHKETREPDIEHVREALGEAGERPRRATRPLVDPKRDREARERLGGTQTRRDEPRDANGGEDGSRSGDEADQAPAEGASELRGALSARAAGRMRPPDRPDGAGAGLWAQVGANDEEAPRRVALATAAIG